MKLLKNKLFLKRAVVIDETADIHQLETEQA